MHFALKAELFKNHGLASACPRFLGLPLQKNDFISPCESEMKSAFLTLCHHLQSAILGGKINELAKFCFLNKRFETNLSFFSKPVIVSHCV